MSMFTNITNRPWSSWNPGYSSFTFKSNRTLFSWTSYFRSFIEIWIVNSSGPFFSLRTWYTRNSRFSKWTFFSVYSRNTFVTWCTFVSLFSTWSYRANTSLFTEWSIITWFSLITLLSFWTLSTLKIFNA